MPVELDIKAQAATFFIAYVWRDYVRQTGAITLDGAAYQRLTGDTCISDLALWPADGVDLAALQSRIRSAAQQAIGIGVFGVAAGFSAQVLARRKEFGLLAHLGLTRRQMLAVVAGEGAAWTGIGAIAGVLLGLAVSVVVLVYVVSPQSFHWTMEMNIPAPRLWALFAAVVVSGTVTAWLAWRAAAGRDAVMAVKEDW